MDNPNLIKPKYSVIILIFHRTQELVDMARDCVASVQNSGENQEIIIVDNGSTVRYDWERECDTYIRLNKNWGISHGWNMGLKAARGSYLVVIGDDVIVHRGWLEAMEKCYEHKDCGWANPHVEHLPAGMGIVENYKWPSGACFMLTPEVIQKVGYFAEDVYFPAQFEDTDYETRVYKAGLKIYTNFGITVQHLEGQTDGAPDISSHYAFNHKRFITRHGFDPVPVFYGNGMMPVFTKG